MSDAESFTRNLKIDSIETLQHPDDSNRHTIQLSWSGDIGFGEYTLFIDNQNHIITADSESMDGGEDKAFLKRLLEVLLEKVEIIG